MATSPQGISPPRPSPDVPGSKRGAGAKSGFGSGRGQPPATPSAGSKASGRGSSSSSSSRSPGESRHGAGPRGGNVSGACTKPNRGARAPGWSRVHLAGSGAVTGAACPRRARSPYPAGTKTGLCGCRGGVVGNGVRTRPASARRCSLAARKRRAWKPTAPAPSCSGGVGSSSWSGPRSCAWVREGRQRERGAASQGSGVPFQLEKPRVTCRG